MPPTWTPNSKITDGLIGGALATVALGTLQVFRPELAFPPGYEAGLAVLFTLGVSYLIPERRAR